MGFKIKKLSTIVLSEKAQNLAVERGGAEGLNAFESIDAHSIYVNY